jgi:hypothetical protein
VSLPHQSLFPPSIPQSILLFNGIYQNREKTKSVKINFTWLRLVSKNMQVSKIVKGLRLGLGGWGCLGWDRLGWGWDGGTVGDGFGVGLDWGGLGWDGIGVGLVVGGGGQMLLSEGVWGVENFGVC